MENGDERGGNDGLYTEELEVAAVDENTLSRLANGDAPGSQEVKPVIEDLVASGVEFDSSGEGKAESKDSDDGEVFEEAIDDMQVQQDQWQSGVTENGDVICAVDNGGVGGTVNEENGEPSLTDDTEKINQEHEKFDEADDVQVESSVSKKGETPDIIQGEEDGKEADMRGTNAEKVEAVTDGGLVGEECFSFPVNDKETNSEIEVEEKVKDVDFAADSAPIDIQVNDVFAEAVADERGSPEVDGLTSTSGCTSVRL